MEAEQNVSTQTSNEASDELQRSVEEWSHEFQQRLQDISGDLYLGDNLQDALESVYRGLTTVSMMCMDLYIKLRYTEEMLREGYEDEDEDE